MTDLEISCQGVLFDCDGVLVDSLPSAERGWSQWAEEYGLDPADVLSGLHGRRSADTVGRFLPEGERAKGLARIEEIEVLDAGSISAIPGAPELLAGLGLKWAVVTSASPALLRARLSAAGLPVPPVLITGADVKVGKPAPDGYLRAAAALGLSISVCVVVEDSATGIAAGRAAQAVHVLGVGKGALATDADTVVADLRGVGWSPTGLRISSEGRLRPAPS
jgi:mannitol-1-/sugar-/sorbitol-6-phosphatase